MFLCDSDILADASAFFYEDENVLESFLGYKTLMAMGARNATTIHNDNISQITLHYKKTDLLAVGDKVANSYALVKMVFMKNDSLIDQK